VRTLGWASDTWQADETRFAFSLLTPFSPVPDPARLSKAALRFLVAPLVCGWIEYDNRQGSAAVELMFGLGDPDGPLRPLGETDPALAGFASNGHLGYATRPAATSSCVRGSMFSRRNSGLPRSARRRF